MTGKRPPRDPLYQTIADKSPVRTKRAPMPPLTPGAGTRTIADLKAKDKKELVTAMLRPRSRHRQMHTFETDPWERQPGESDKQWAAFVHFRDSGAGKRSLANTIKAVDTKSCTWWSASMMWQVRAAAWDRELDRQNRLAQIEAVQEMSKRQIQIALLQQNIGVKQMKKLDAAADKIPDPLLEPKEMLDFVRDGVKLERLNRGEPEEITEQRHELTVGERRSRLRNALDTDRAHQLIEQMADIFLEEDTEDDASVVDAEEPLEELEHDDTEDAPAT